MAIYFVEGEITIKIDCGEIEADSLADAEAKMFQKFKEDHPTSYYAEVESHDLSAGQYEGDEYND